MLHYQNVTIKHSKSNVSLKLGKQCSHDKIQIYILQFHDISLRHAWKHDQHAARLVVFLMNHI